VTATEPLRRNVTPVRVTSIRGGRWDERADTLATEEPLEIRVQGLDGVAHQVAVTMRTPGGDFELAAGFLFTEGLVAPAEIGRVAYCDDVEDAAQRFNVVTVSLGRPFDADRLRRNFYATSSCGVCGKAALEDVEVRCAPVPEGAAVALDVVLGLPERLRAAQKVFDRTGGLHAAGLFTLAGDTIGVREDVGRHNAVDKVVGERLLAGDLPLGDVVLQVSGRLSFEIVQKAAVAGVPIVSAVGAPSSLAVEAAQRSGVTLVGFVRDTGCNIYTRPDRIT
jgi:FdhD protein